jgi:hypothetical protein
MDLLDAGLPQTFNMSKKKKKKKKKKTAISARCNKARYACIVEQRK